MVGTSKPAKEFRTVQNRWVHYLMLAHDMRWGDDLTQTVVTAMSLGRRGTLQLAIYALHLWSGNNLRCRSLKLATIQRYISNVASFLCIFGRACVDYRYATVGDKGFIPVKMGAGPLSA